MKENLLFRNKTKISKNKINNNITNIDFYDLTV